MSMQQQRSQHINFYRIHLNCTMHINNLPFGATLKRMCPGCCVCVLRFMENWKKNEFCAQWLDVHRTKMFIRIKQTEADACMQCSDTWHSLSKGIFAAFSFPPNRPCFHIIIGFLTVVFIDISYRCAQCVFSQWEWRLNRISVVCRYRGWSTQSIRSTIRLRNSHKFWSDSLRNNATGHWHLLLVSPLYCCYRFRSDDNGYDRWLHVCPYLCLADVWKTTSHVMQFGPFLLDQFQATSVRHFSAFRFRTVWFIICRNSSDRQQ